MPYSLVLREPGEEGSKSVGENIFLDDLPTTFPVFGFYYPAEMPDARLESALRGLGERAGENLLINICRLDDPQLPKVVKRFEISSFPSLVLSATADLAAPPDEFLNAFVRLDNRLLADPERATRLIESLYLLFLKGEIAQAIRLATWKNRQELATAILQKVAGVLGRIGGFLADRDFSVSLIEGRFEMTKSG